VPAPGFDPYAILGVSQGASLLEIARARRRRAKQYHPDLAGGAGRADDSRMREINEAWRILVTPSERADWDAAHGAAGPGSHWARPAPRRYDTSGSAASGGPASWASDWSWRPAGAAAATAARRPIGTPVERSWRESGWVAAGVVAVLAFVVLIGFVALGPPPSVLPERGGDAPMVQDNLDRP
jgi:hypothetical protein